MKKTYTAPRAREYEIRERLMGTISGYSLEGLEVKIHYGGVDTEGELEPESRQARFYDDEDDWDDFDE